jgi:formiminotetrahydrofolate cyclodeaminase
MKQEEHPLILDLSLRDFARALAAREPTPGGGAAAAYTGAMAAALARMAILYSINDERIDDKEKARLEEVERFMDELREDLMRLAEEDTRAYGAFSQALKLPRKTAEEKKARKETIQQALEGALEVPLEAASRCLEGLDRLENLKGAITHHLITDLGVAGQCFAAACRSCGYNVWVNARSLKDKDRAGALLRRKESVEADAGLLEASLVREVEKVLGEA